MEPSAELFTTLRKTPLLSLLDETAIADFLRTCQTVALPAGRQVFRPGEPAERFYIVLTGQVQIYKLSATGDQQILHLYGPGDSFGEAAMWAGIGFPAHAQTLTDSRLLVVTRMTLRQDIANNPELAMGMLAGLSAKLREFNTLIEQLSLRQVPSRLATVLLEELRHNGTRSFTLSQTKRQLASRIGTVPETLSRALATLKRRGAISVKGAQITVLDEPALDEIARQS